MTTSCTIEFPTITPSASAKLLYHIDPDCTAWMWCRSSPSFARMPDSYGYPCNYKVDHGGYNNNLNPAGTGSPPIYSCKYFEGDGCVETYSPTFSKNFYNPAWPYSHCNVWSTSYTWHRRYYDVLDLSRYDDYWTSKTWCDDWALSYNYFWSDGTPWAYPSDSFPGVWVPVCGDETFGPPALPGIFLGQIQYICHCPDKIPQQQSMFRPINNYPIVESDGPFKGLASHEPDCVHTQLCAGDTGGKPYHLTRALKPEVGTQKFHLTGTCSNDIHDDIAYWTWCPCSSIDYDGPECKPSSSEAVTITKVDIPTFVIVTASLEEGLHSGP